jgi:Caspase domain
MTSPRWRQWSAIGVLAVTCSAWPTAGGANSVGRRYALLIGASSANRTNVPKLSFVENDLVELRELLQREDYEVVTISNERANRKQILEELYGHATRLRENDTFLLYYAGHGVRNVEINRKTYWLTEDADLAMLDLHGIRLEHLLSYVDDIKANNKLVLLDHCFSGDVEGLRLMSSGGIAPGSPAGSVTGPQLTRSAVVVDVSREIGDPRNRAIAVIAAARGPAFELTEIKHGVFTKALLDACATDRGADGDKRSIGELTTFLQFQVPNLLKAGPETQEVVGRTEGASVDWAFCTVPVAAAALAARVDTYLATIQDWEAKSLLPPQGRAACAAVLEKWKMANGDQSALSLAENRVLTTLRLFAGGSDLRPDQLRAAALNDVLLRVGLAQ